MSINESIIEDAALIMPAASLTRPHSAGEESRRLREAIRRLNPAIGQFRTLSTLRDTLLPKLLSGELSVVATQAEGINV